MGLLDLAFVQRGILEIAALSLAAGVLGTWIVLRGLAFYAHAVGTAAFPGLVLADGLGFSATLGAFGTAAVVAAAVALLSRREGGGHDATTALVLVAALAAGVILASDVFGSQARVDQLLFGSLLLVDGNDVAFAAAASGAVVLGTLALGPRWLVAGFDATSARAAGLRTARTDAVLLALVALVAVASLSALGALLATALLVVPAATTRLLFDRLRTWQLATVVLVLVEGTAGLLISVELNAPPGSAIAVLAGAVFALVAVVRAWAPRLRGGHAAAAAAAAAAVLAAGCGASAGGAGGGALRVLASTPVVADLAKNVAGPDARVAQVLQPNTDPHEYEPRPDDVRAAAGADVILASGLGLDKFMSDVAKQAGSGAAIQLGDGVPTRLGSDPHWWHDPRNAAAAVDEIAAALGKADPAHRAGYAARAAAYRRRLVTLETGVRRCLGLIAPAGRKLVTDHDAFGYFARRYGVQVVGAVIPSLTTRAQPSAGDLARLARTIRGEHVRAVFPESSVNRRLAEAIARQTGARSDFTLYGDTLGPRGSEGATYVGAEAHNAREVVRGLSGDAKHCRLAP